MRFLWRIILANVVVGAAGHLMAYLRYINNPFLHTPSAESKSVLEIILVCFLIAVLLILIGLVAYRMLADLDQFLYHFEKDRSRLESFPPEKRERVAVEAYNLPYTTVVLTLTLGAGMALIVHTFNYTIPYRGMLSFSSQFRIIFDYVVVILMTGVFIFFVNATFIPGIVDRVVEAGFPLPDFDQSGLTRVELGVKLGVAFLCVVLFPLYLSSADIFSVFQSFVAGGEVPAETIAPVKMRFGANVFIYGTYCGLLVIVATRSVVFPLFRLVRGTSRIFSGEPAPDEMFLPVSVDELGDLAISVDGMRQNLARQLQEIRERSEKTERFVLTIQEVFPTLVNLIAQMMEISRKQEFGASQQFEAIRLIRERVANLSEVVTGVAESTRKVVEWAGDAQGAGEEGTRTIGGSRRSIEEIADGAQEMEERIRVFSNLGEDVERILQIIEGIANRSDILALNATLLGAKAGESGEGFMLIAERLRGLAEAVMREANRVRPILRQIEVNAREVLREIENNREETRRSQQMVVQADESFREIYQAVGQTREAAEAISRDTQQQKSLAAGMVKEISSAAEIAEEAMAVGKDSTGMAERLTRISEQLKVLTEGGTSSA